MGVEGSGGREGERGEDAKERRKIREEAGGKQVSGLWVTPRPPDHPFRRTPNFVLLFPFPLLGFFSRILVVCSGGTLKFARLGSRAVM